MSIVALATAATFAIVGVLRPQPRLAIDTETVVRFAAPPAIYMDAPQIKGETLASLGKSLEAERSLNERRARWADLSARALLVGLLGVALQALLLGMDELLY